MSKACIYLPLHIIFTADSYLRHPNSYLPRYNIQSETDGECAPLTGTAGGKRQFKCPDIGPQQIIESDEEDVPSYGFPAQQRRRNRRETSDIDLIINNGGKFKFFARIITFLNYYILFFRHDHFIHVHPYTFDISTFYLYRSYMQANGIHCLAAIIIMVRRIATFQHTFARSMTRSANRSRRQRQPQKVWNGRQASHQLKSDESGFLHFIASIEFYWSFCGYIDCTRCPLRHHHHRAQLPS